MRNHILAGLATITFFIFSSWLYETRTVMLPIPESIRLALGEANRTQEWVFPSDWNRSGGQPYVEIEGLTLNDLPPEALCSGNNTSSIPMVKTTKNLTCSWQSVGDNSYKRATINLDVPDLPHLYGWLFDRQSLSMVPVVNGWYDLNIGRWIAFVSSALLWCLCLLWLRDGDIQSEGF